MSKKKIEPITISAPSSGETLTAGRQSVRGLGTTAANTNVSGGVTQLAGLLNLLGPSGAVAMDPALRAQFDSLQTSVTGATRGPLQQIGNLQTQIANLQSKGDKLKPGQQRQLEKLQGKLESLQSRVDFQNQRLTDFQNNTLAGAPKPTDRLREAFPELQRTLDEANPYLDRMGQLGAAGERLMGALGQGFESREVGRGAAGEALYNRATQMASSDGRLSPEANRDAVQSARQAFSARGLGTGSGAAAAELLNRDQYSRQRMFQDLGFANQISEQDQRRQFANEEGRRLGTQLNTSMLGQAFTTDRMVNQEGLGAALQRGQLAGAANPANMLLQMYGQGQPVGSQSIGAGAEMGANWANNKLTADTFNAQSSMWSNYANSIKPGNNTLTGSPWGDFALNKGIDLTSNLASAAIAKSDRRLKENIKPIGKAGGILGLNTYRFDYKNGKKGVIGFMAQEVQKVLPEAVVEFWENGKRYLGIKPEVIGKAIADELMAQAQPA